ncbi:UNVERIFIED_CONTAM: hypothetical protein HDU68_000953 [Siphonaria sp. JEL0065]|nr:hypothetical protein HDU68_000953 [Siphonaria sp. JEL0065]
MQLPEPTPFSTASHSSATSSTLPAATQLFQESLAHISALDFQHKSLCSLLRSLVREDFPNFLYTLPEPFPCSIAMKSAYETKIGILIHNGGSAVAVLNGRRCNNVSRLTNSSPTDGDAGGLAVLSKTYGRGPLGAPRKRKQTRGVGDADGRKRVAVDKRDQGRNDVVEAGGFGGTWDASFNVSNTSTLNSNGGIDLVDDPFMDFVDMAVSQPEASYSTRNRHQELGVFNPYYSYRSEEFGGGGGREEEEEKDDDEDLSLESVSERDWDLFGVGGCDVIEEDLESVVSSTLGTITPPSFVSTPRL